MAFDKAGPLANREMEGNFTEATPLLKTQNKNGFKTGLLGRNGGKRRKTLQPKR
jgi:hypothetical protein